MGSRRDLLTCPIPLPNSIQSVRISQPILNSIRPHQHAHNTKLFIHSYAAMVTWSCTLDIRSGHRTPDRPCDTSTSHASDALEQVSRAEIQSLSKSVRASETSFRRCHPTSHLSTPFARTKGELVRRTKLSIHFDAHRCRGCLYGERCQGIIPVCFTRWHTCATTRKEMQRRACAKLCDAMR